MKTGADTLEIRSFEPLGQRLREEREQQGRSLRQIADRTRIPINVLEAIENGDPTQLPAPVFVKGFLRSYSIEIGLPPETVLQEYRSLNPEKTSPVGVPITARRGFEGGSLLRNFVIFIILVAIAAGAIWYSWPTIAQTALYQQYFGKQTPVVANADDINGTLPESEGDFRPPAPSEDMIPTPDPEVKPVEGAGTPSEVVPVVSPNSPDASSTDVAPSGAPPMTDEDRAAVETATLSQPPESGHELVLVFSKTSWVQVVPDGGKALHGLFKSGETKTYKAEEGFKVRLGNAGGVKVIFDGEDLGSLGAEGRAVSLNLPKKNNHM